MSSAGSTARFGVRAVLAAAAVTVVAVPFALTLLLVKEKWARAAQGRRHVGGAHILALGFSRVALGVHYLSDVVAGLVLGLAWVAAMTAAFNATSVDLGRRGPHLREKSPLHSCPGCVIGTPDL